MVVGASVTFDGPTQEIRGNIAMSSSGIFYFHDGILDWTRDAIMSGHVTVSLYKVASDTSYIYATTRDPEQPTLTIQLDRGVHEMEIDESAGIHISVIGRGGHSSNRGRLYINGTSEELSLPLLDISGYTSVLVAINTTLNVRNTILGVNGALDGPGAIVTETLDWQSGSLSSGVHVRVRDVTQIGFKQQIPRLASSNVTLEGPAYFGGSSQITLENANIKILNKAIVENGLQVNPTSSSTWATVQVLGRIGMVCEAMQLSLLIDVYNEGHILAGNNNLEFGVILNSGVVQSSNAMTLQEGGVSVFTSNSTSIFAGTLEIKDSSELVVDTDQASFRLHGISGRLVVSEGIRLVLPFVRIETGFELHVQGTLVCKEMYLNGGIITGSGSISCVDMEWIAGTISIGSLHVNGSSGMSITHLLISPSSFSKTIQSGSLQIVEKATVSDGASVVLQGLALLENQGSLTCLPGGKIEGGDSGSMLVNDGEINILGGNVLSTAKLHCSLHSQGNITISDGTAELCSDGLNCSVSGLLYVSNGAALVFTGGSVFIEPTANFRVDGKFQSVVGSGVSGTFVVKSGESPFYLASVEIISGTVSILRPHTLQPVPAVRCSDGGTLIIGSQFLVNTLWIQGGRLLMRSQLSVAELFFWLGTIESDVRQSRVTASYIEWLGGSFVSTPGKRFLIDVEENLVISGSGNKEIRNAAVLTVKTLATFGSVNPITLSGGGLFIIGDSATLNISGTVTYSSGTGSIQNDGTIVIGVDELTLTRVSFASFLSNNGRIIATNTELSFLNGGDLGGNDVFLHNGSTLRIDSGNLIIPPESLGTSSDITVDGGTLVLQSGHYGTEFHVTVLAGQVNVIATDIEDPATSFLGEIHVAGGALNVTGDLRVMGNMYFTEGTLLGTGETHITSTGKLEVRYGLNIGGGRSVSMGLLSSHGITRLFSPLTILSGSVFKISEASTTYLMSYADLLGTGIVLNLGILAVEVSPEHTSSMTVNFYNHWLVDGRQGQLWLAPTGSNRVLLEDTSQLSGNGTIIDDRGNLGVILDGEIWVQGNVYIHEPCYITGTLHWIRGVIYNAATQCSSSSLMVSSCHERFVVVQGTLLIENGDYDKLVSTEVVLINEGSLMWTAGLLRCYSMTLINKGNFLVGSENSNLRLERWHSHIQPQLENHANMVIAGSSVSLHARVINYGDVSVSSLTTLSLETFQQQAATAVITGTDATLAGTIGGIIISQGKISWSGTIIGQLSLTEATVATRGKQIDRAGRS